MKNYMDYSDGDLFDPLKKNIKFLIQKDPTYIVFISESDSIEYYVRGFDWDSKLSLVIGEITSLRITSEEILPDQKSYNYKIRLASVLALLLDGKKVEPANQELEKIRSDLDEKVANLARSWTVNAAFLAMLLSMIIALIIWFFRAEIGDFISPVVPSILILSLFGSVGSVATMLLKDNSTKVDLSLGKGLNHLDGFYRVSIGVIGALVANLAISAELIAGSLKFTSDINATLILVSIIAGSSERFLPSIISRFESQYLIKNKKSSNETVE